MDARRRFLGALAACAAAWSTGAISQSYPARQITIYVGSAAGGSLDSIARVLGEQLQKKWGQPVVVENRPGGGGVLASAAMIRLPADGHALSLGGGMSQSIFIKNPGYDPLDLTPVSLVGQSPYTLIVSRKANIASVQQLVAQSRANPGKLNVGMVALGPHEAETAAMEHALGIKANVIGYKAFVAIETALITGELDAAMTGNIGRVKTGELIALATGGEQRFSEIPQVPTFREAGIDYNPVANYLVWIRAGTPVAIIDRLAAECALMAKTPEFEARFVRAFGIPAVGSNRDVALREARREFEHLKAAAARAGIQPQ
jgi:tripartite-type tricarboxylate transporter receptor subunit TctC